MRKLLLVSAALVAAGCSDSTESRVPTSVVIAPAALTFDALRTTQVVRATVNDQKGRALGGQALTWSSSSPSVTIVSSAGDSAVVSAAKNGTAQITARVAEATGTAQAQVSAAGSLNLATVPFQAVPAGTNVPLTPRVTVRDSRAAPVPGVEVVFTATEGNSVLNGGGNTATVVTDANGVAALTSWRTGPGAILNILTVQTSDLTAAPVTVQASGCAGGGGAGYGITLCFITKTTPSQRAVFESAAARWATVITGDLQDVRGPIPENACGKKSPTADFTYDDLVLYAAASDIDGPNGVLGQAGPCFIRNSNNTPILGFMEFDNADLAQLESGGGLFPVILHEMGHVIGIGTLWEDFGLLENPSSEGQVLDTYYTGAEGRAGFDAIGGATYMGGQKVPVENTGGEGTANGHWRESVLKNELMTGFLGNGSNPMSILTVRSLIDMGYTVNPGAADPFNLNTAALRSGDPFAPKIRMHDDIWRGPLYRMDPRGGRTRIR